MKEKMKKVIIFLLACLAANARCMEVPVQPETESEFSRFAALPDELIVYLFSFVPECTSMKEIFNKLVRLSLANKKFAQIAEDHQLFNELAQRFITVYPQGVKKEFLDAVKQILKNNRTQQCNKIVIALVFGISEKIKNKKLIKVAIAGNKDLVKILLDAGADVDAANNRGITALMYVRDYMLAQFLISNGADFNAEDERGYTALIYASFCGYQDIVKLLLDNGADVNGANFWCETALMDASKYGHTETVKLLLAAGADVNIVADNWGGGGTTALINASANGHTEVVKLLLDFGADRSMRDVVGDTALSKASRNGHKDIVNWLEAIQANR